jgi:hypothetical protein
MYVATAIMTSFVISKPMASGALDIIMWENSHSPHATDSPIKGIPKTILRALFIACGFYHGALGYNSGATMNDISIIDLFWLIQKI